MTLHEDAAIANHLLRGNTINTYGKIITNKHLHAEKNNIK
jgi:hypothetical protein